MNLVLLSHALIGILLLGRVNPETTPIEEEEDTLDERIQQHLNMSQNEDVYTLPENEGTIFSIDDNPVAPSSSESTMSTTAPTTTEAPITATETPTTATETPTTATETPTTTTKAPTTTETPTTTEAPASTEAPSPTFAPKSTAPPAVERIYKDCRPELAAEVSRRFAYQFFRQTALNNKKENLFTASSVVGTTLAMILAGAKNKTREQIISGLQLDKVANFSDYDLTCLLGMYRNDLDEQSLESRLKDDRQPLPPISLMTASKLFGAKDFTFKKTFLEQIKNYGSGLEMLDFMQEPEISREKINKWVAGMTGDTIKNLFAPEAIKPATKLALVSAIYFKGTWKFPFKERQTFSSNFSIKENSKVKVEFMNNQKNYRWLYSDRLRSDIVELPYKKNAADKYNISMVLIVPKGFYLESVEESITEEVMQGIIQDLMNKRPYNLNVLLPKFKIEAEYNLQPILRDMGVKNMFNPHYANLWGMVNETQDTPPLHVSKAIHKTYIEVDEKGTKASGASGITIIPLSLPRTVRCDKPFLVMIYEKNSDTVLFMGRVGNPSVSG